jgi:hypothetical protein
MSARPLLWLSVAAACGLGSSRVAAQGAGDVLGEARGQLRERNLDSAAALLRRITDSTRWTDSARRIDALVLLGMVRYYQGDDSASLVAFRGALTLDPALVVPRLAQLDSTLGARFDSAKVALPHVPDPDTLYICSPRCEGLDVPPQRVESGPSMGGAIILELVDVGGESLHGTALLRAIVDTLGGVEAGSVEVVRSDVLQDLLDHAVQSLLTARFRPGRAHGRPVRVLIEQTVQLRFRSH